METIKIGDRVRIRIRKHWYTGTVTGAVLNSRGAPVAYTVQIDHGAIAEVPRDRIEAL